MNDILYILNHQNISYSTVTSKALGIIVYIENSYTPIAAEVWQFNKSLLEKLVEAYARSNLYI